jgi:hypothetical protein
MRTSTSSDGSFTGKVRIRTAFRSWKIALLAPTPRPRDRIATAANPGLRRRIRAP